MFAFVHERADQITAIHGGLLEEFL
jgi:hypothetical protein